jgi:hypothetical protein
LLARDRMRFADDHPEPRGQRIHGWPTGGIKAQTAIDRGGQGDRPAPRVADRLDAARFGPNPGGRHVVRSVARRLSGRYLVQRDADFAGKSAVKRLKMPKVLKVLNFSGTGRGNIFFTEAVLQAAG